MLQKIIHVLLVGLFFMLPIIHSSFLESFGFHTGWGVDGNFEFSKSQFFIYISSIISLLFGLHIFSDKKDMVFPNVLFFIIGVLIITSVFSLSPYTAFFGLDSKGHGSLMFLCLVSIYIILIQQNKNMMKQYFWASIAGGLCVALISIKEYFFPSFYYGDLSNRAVGTFGHPNYLVLYCLLLLPFLFEKTKKLLWCIPLVLIVTLCIFLTKSMWGLVIFFSYSLYLLVQKYKSHQVIIYSAGIIGVGIIYYILYQFGFSTKLHSFLSRFYIWESTLRVLFHNPHIFFIGSGADTLLSYFSIYKSPELYIFENFGFSADRPHNIFLNILFHFGVVGIAILGYALYLLKKNWKNNYIYHSIIIFLSFCFFNFASIASYLLLILCIACITKQNNKKTYSFLFSNAFVIVGIIGTLGASIFYYAETLAHSGNHRAASRIFPFNYSYYEHIGDTPAIEKYAGYKTNNYFISQLQDGANPIEVCDAFTQSKDNAESYVYCGNLFWNNNAPETARDYYTQGLERLPDLWNSESKYYHNPIVSNYVDGTRFFSKKYSNLSDILKRVGYTHTEN